MVLSYPEDGGSRFPRNHWRQFTELFGVTYQELYLASQRVCEHQMCAGKG